MTPDLKYKQYVLDKLVSDLEGFLVYYNPEFKSWWWINPDTKEWRFEFKDHGSLYWFYGWGDNFMFKYSLEESEFVEVISRYVEHTLQNGVVNTSLLIFQKHLSVEHTLQNGVVNTRRNIIANTNTVEHILQNGVVNTRKINSSYFNGVEHTIQNGVVNSSPSGRFRKGVEETIENGIVNTQRNFLYKTEDVEETIQNGVFHTAHIYSPLGDRVEHTLENGVINTKQ